MILQDRGFLITNRFNRKTQPPLKNFPFLLKLNCFWLSKKNGILIYCPVKKKSNLISFFFCLFHQKITKRASPLFFIETKKGNIFKKFKFFKNV